MYIDFKIGDSKLDQFSFMEMTNLEYSMFKEMFFKYIDNFLIQNPKYGPQRSNLNSAFNNAEKEIIYYENLIALKEL
jgi:hypothetical protein